MLRRSSARRRWRPRKATDWRKLRQPGRRRAAAGEPARWRASPAAPRRASARVRICEQALRALEPDAQCSSATSRCRTTRVVLRYRADGRRARAGLPLHAARAWRATAGSGRRASLPQEGALSPSGPVPAQDLRPGRGAQAARPAARPAGPILAQQLVNALAPAAIYALLATGYALIYGITGRINLAFGEFTTVGAFAALTGILVAARRPRRGARGPGAGGPRCWPPSTGAALGAVLYGLVFAPLQRRSSQALLIATDRARHRARRGPAPADRLAPALAAAASSPTPSHGGPIMRQPRARSCSPSWPLAAVAAVAWLLRRTAFGRAYRACADDPGGGGPGGRRRRPDGRARPASWAACWPAVAGFVIAAHYGVVGFAMGTLLGLKALTAAVVGGIGSVPGAALGGVLIGLLESFWAGYLPGAYREVAVFGAARVDAGAAAGRPVRPATGRAPTPCCGAAAQGLSGSESRALRRILLNLRLSDCSISWLICFRASTDPMVPCS